MLAPPPEDTGAARTDATHGEHGTAKHVTSRRGYALFLPKTRRSHVSSLHAMSLNGVKGQARTTNKECNF